MSPPTHSPPTEPTEPTIDDLPAEMINELFKYLHLKDLAACSLVNKRWHSIYADFKVHKLFVDDDRELVKWYDSNQTVREAEQLDSLEMFGRLVEKPLLSNLKYLALCGSFEFDLNKLNRFRQLVHLEIHTFYDRTRLQFNLPKLQVLAFHYWNEDCRLSIDCPLLNTLLYYGDHEDANLLKVKHPETIRKLETEMEGAKLVRFKNVECLVTREFQVISKATLQSLPRLRELRFNGNIERVFEKERDHGAGAVDRMKRTLSEFLDEAKKLRGRDFRFTFSGFLLTNVNVDQIDFGVQVSETGREQMTNEGVYMKNYHLIEPGTIDFVGDIDYTSLLSHVTGEFPRCFLQKFSGIHSVSTSGKVQDADQFLSFLKSLRSLRSLSLRMSELSQEFYDQLPAFAQSLRSLYLTYHHCEKGLQLNFDFVGRLLCLSRLSCCYVDPDLSLESARSLVRWLGRLEECSFSVKYKDYNYNRITYYFIYKDDSVWRIERNPDERILESEDSDEIRNFIEALQDRPENPESD